METSSKPALSDRQVKIIRRGLVLIAEQEPEGAFAVNELHGINDLLRDLQRDETARAERDRLKLAMAALEVDDRLFKLVATVIRLATVERHQLAQGGGSVAVGLLCNLCGAECNYPNRTIEHKPTCIIAGCFDG